MDCSRKHAYAQHYSGSYHSGLGRRVTQLEVPTLPAPVQQLAVSQHSPGTVYIYQFVMMLNEPKDMYSIYSNAGRHQTSASPRRLSKPELLCYSRYSRSGGQARHLVKHCSTAWALPTCKCCQLAAPQLGRTTQQMNGAGAQTFPVPASVYQGVSLCASWSLDLASLCSCPNLGPPRAPCPDMHMLGLLDRNGKLQCSMNANSFFLQVLSTQEAQPPTFP